MTKQISFDTTKTEGEIICKIAARASKAATTEGFKYPVMDAQMDVTAAHLNGCPLDLARLLAADYPNFTHDVFGIRRHLNRNTGDLENCFLPRHALPEKA